MDLTNSRLDLTNGRPDQKSTAKFYEQKGKETISHVPKDRQSRDYEDEAGKEEAKA